MKRSPETSPIYLPTGFTFSAIAAGIKASGHPDLALVECKPGTRGAAVFTSNRVAAAPVLLGRVWLKATQGRIRAVVVNSGNANCATGKPGIDAAERVCGATAKLLGAEMKEIFPSSTGIIGVPFPTHKILAKLKSLALKRQSSVAGVKGFADAILTTDTRRKLASEIIQIKGRDFKLLGIAKGSGMIHPQLATMLVYLFTDVVATSFQLNRILQEVCNQTFNCMSVDGDTSTNDTVLLLASGGSGLRLSEASVNQACRTALLRVCQSLAQQVIKDGEGVHHVVQLRIEQARSRAEGLQIARAIAHSLLVKTAWAGADPNWGRILAATGNSGIAVDPRRINIFIGKQQVCRDGHACRFNKEVAHRQLSKPQSELRVQLGRGYTTVRFFTTDLTAEYVRINADYST